MQVLQRRSLGGNGGVLLGNRGGGVGAEAVKLRGQLVVGNSQDCHGQIGAFLAPFSATVATGNPLGICTVASNASRPSIVPPFIGMPTTGRVVLAAKAPARCAAMPAAQRMTP